MHILNTEREREKINNIAIAPNYLSPKSPAAVAPALAGDAR